MKTIIAKGRHVMGKLSRNCDKAAPRNCEAALTWELRQDGDKLEFSACGEVWNHLKTDIVRGGQCVDELAAMFPRDVLAQRIRQTWARYHLNGMNAGTPEQKAHAQATEAAHRWDYAKVCDELRAAGLYEVPVTPELRAAALGGLPDDATVYRYGSRWLHFPIPADVVELVKRGFQDADAPGAIEHTADPSEAGEPDRDLIAEAGLTVAAVFVPWSQSRNKGERSPSLNWRVTLQCKGRDVLTCDYSAGSAHCPVNRNASFKRTASPRDLAEAVRLECEGGKAIKRMTTWGAHTFGDAIKPDPRDVIRSLLLDAGTLDAGSFADWCADYGYSADSMSARRTYDECIAHAVAIRGAVGPAMFEALREGNE